MGTVDLLAKACAHAGIKAIGVKTTVGIFNLKKKKKKKHEQMDGMVVFSKTSSDVF